MAVAVRHCSLSFSSNVTLWYVVIHPWGVGFEGNCISISAIAAVLIVSEYILLCVCVCLPVWVCITVINFMNRALKSSVKKILLFFLCLKRNICICTHTYDNVVQSYDHKEKNKKFPPLTFTIYTPYISLRIIHRNSYASLIQLICVCSHNFFSSSKNIRTYRWENYTAKCPKYFYLYIFCVRNNKSNNWFWSVVEKRARW